MVKYKIVGYLYFVFLLADLAAILLEMEQIRLITKSVLMPVLLVYAFIRFNHRGILFKLLVGALVFSWMGDVVLLFDSEKDGTFIVGLLAFLVAHIVYIISYRKARLPDTSLALYPTQQMRYLFIILMAGIAMTTILYPFLEGLKLPVMLYSTILVLMVIAALYRYGRTGKGSFALVLLGAVLFMASDSMLAISKFVASFQGSGVLIMLTYGTAQFLIVEGLARHPLSPE